MKFMLENIYQKFLPLCNSRGRPLLIYSGSIELDSDEQIFNALKEVSEDIKEFDFLLNTEGGDPNAAYRITQILSQKFEKINLLVPFWAKSAGTLICLCANELFLSQLSELGPLDTQAINHGAEEGRSYESVLTAFSALEEIRKHNFKVFDTFVLGMLQRGAPLRLTRIFDLATSYCGNTCGKLYDQIDLNLIGKYSRALNISSHYAKRILIKNQSFKDIDNKEGIIERLVRGYPDHGTVINREELLKVLQFPVNIEDLDTLSKLDELMPLTKSLLKNGTSLCKLIKPEQDNNNEARSNENNTEE
jgi:hypothetical protein